MNTKCPSILKVLIAASMLVGFCSYAFTPPAMAKPGSPADTNGDTPSSGGRGNGSATASGGRGNGGATASGGRGNGGATASGGRGNDSNLSRCAQSAVQDACS